MRFFLLASLIAIQAAFGTLYAQGTASGSITVGKDKFEMKHARAILVPDSFDKAKTKTRIVIADQPIPEGLMEDESGLWDLKSKGYHGLVFEITQDKANYSLVVISPTLQGSLSSSGTFDSSRLSVFTNRRVEGSIEDAPRQMAGNLFGYQIKFATAVATPEPPPTAADTAAAASKESTKAYLALMAAVRAGDKKTILEMSPPERRASIDTPEFPQMLKMVQAMTPKNIRVLKAVETGDEARLTATGSSEGKEQRGRILMKKNNGKWTLVSESWSGR